MVCITQCRNGRAVGATAGLYSTGKRNTAPSSSGTIVILTLARACAEAVARAEGTDGSRSKLMNLPFRPSDACADFARRAERCLKNLPLPEGGVGASNAVER